MGANPRKSELWSGKTDKQADNHNRKKMEKKNKKINK